MAILIPITPLGTQTTYTLRSNAIRLTPTLGGPTQSIASLGDRWEFNVNCRSFSYADGVSVASILNQGVANKLLFPVPQPGFTLTGIGTPVVSSGAGTSLSITGFTAGYVIRDGQFFSLIHNGIRYLHQVRGQVTATGGSATLTVQPMLKVAPNAGATCEFAQPYLEGFLASPTQSFSVGLTKTVSLSFTIAEAQ